MEFALESAMESMIRLLQGDGVADVKKCLQHLTNYQQHLPLLCQTGFLCQQQHWPRKSTRASWFTDHCSAMAFILGSIQLIG